MVSHTFTVVHTPTLRKIGASWNLQRGRELFGYDRSYNAGGWPDTETGFGAVLRAAGISPKLIGPETNYERQITDWWDHARSVTGTRAYSDARTPARIKREAEGQEAYRAALARVAQWKRDDLLNRR